MTDRLTLTAISQEPVHADVDGIEVAGAGGSPFKGSIVSCVGRLTILNGAMPTEIELIQQRKRLQDEGVKFATDEDMRGI